MKQELRIDCSIDLNEFIGVVSGSSKKNFQNSATGVCLDTRSLKKGDLFFAVQGVRDGHEFAKTAASMGASACVVSRDMGLENQILVSDTLQSLWRFAGFSRERWGKKIVALSGSNGKTSTKEMMAVLLGDNTLKTPGTWNNFLGVPLTLLMLEKDHDYGVVEMGINHFGELLQLCRFTKPDVAVLTNVGPAHLQEFRDLDGVAKAKGEIFSQLQPNQTAVLNIDDARIENMKKDIRAKIVTVSQKKSADVQILSKTRKDNGYNLTVGYGNEEMEVFLPLAGEHNVSNYLCSLGAAYALNISIDQVKNQTPKITQVHMRMQEIRLSKNRTIINDCYNANPGSFQAGLQTVSETNPTRFLILMGDMLELGEDSGKIHHEVGRMLLGYGVGHLFVVGGFAKEVIAGAIEGGISEEKITHIDKREQAVEKILPYFNTGDILLVKGSRGMKLEEIISELEQRLKGA